MPKAIRRENTLNISIMEPIRILCYNVCGFPWNHHSHEQIQEIVQWMIKTADVIAFQEVWSNQSEWGTCFAKENWLFDYPPRENHFASVFGSGLAVAWNPMKWSVTGIRFFPFVSAVGLDQFAMKGWMRVNLVEKSSGVKIRLLNTHMQSDYEVFDDVWQHISNPVREQQSRELANIEQKYLKEIPILIVGDFNTRECLIPHAHFLNPQTIPTFPESAKFLDHIATWNTTDRTIWKLESHEVFVEKKWSDHYPIRWILTLHHT